MNRKRRQGVLAIDVGNTNVSVGLFQGRRLLREWRLPTQSLSRSLPRRSLLRATPPEQLQGVIFCSVVPRATRLLKRRLAALLPSLPIYVVGQDILCPLPNRYRRPKQVGQDRLVNAYACLRLYGAPAIICDFGTAVTIDFLSKKGEYMGGIICPGIRISLEALAEKTALLPKVSLKPPRQLLGRETVETIRSGAFYGFAGLCDGLVERLRERYGKRIKAVLTGGHTDIISTYCKTINYKNRLLTLQGLNYLFLEVSNERHRKNE